MDKFLKFNLEYKRLVSYRYNCISDLLTLSQNGTWVSWVRLKPNMEDLLCGLQRIQLHPCGKINEHRQPVSLPTSPSLALTLPSFHSGPGLCVCVWPFRTYNLTCPSAHSAFSGVLIFCCCAMLITPAAAAAAAVGRLNCLSLRQVRRFGVQLWQNTAILPVPLRQNATPENLLLHWNVRVQFSVRLIDAYSPAKPCQVSQLQLQNPFTSQWSASRMPFMLIVKCYTLAEGILESKCIWFSFEMS